MRVGFRKPSWKRSFSARTKGRFTRAVSVQSFLVMDGEEGVYFILSVRYITECIAEQRSDWVIYSRLYSSNIIVNF